MGYRTLLRDHRSVLSIAFLAMFSSSLGQSYFVGLFQAPLADHWQLSAGQFGTAYSVVTLVAGFVMLRLGPSIDWIAPRRFAITVLIALIVGVALLTLSPWWWLGVLGLGLVRLCGQGMLTHLGNTLAAREFTTLRGRAMGLASLGIPFGEALLPPLVAFSLLWLSWPSFWWLLCAALALPWLWLLHRAPWSNAPNEKPVQRDNSGPQPFRDPHFWLLLPLLMALPITMTGLFIYQAQLTEALDSSLSVYALALAGMGVAKLPGALLGGRWIDKIGPTRLARLYLLPYATAMLFATVAGGDASVWALMVGGGLAMGAQELIASGLLIRLWGIEHLGRVRSALSASMVFSTGIAPAALGLALSAGVPFSAILGAMLLFIVVAWCLAQGTLKVAQQAPRA
ncbi:MFS transporter [Vreelandella arcis]|uniref:Predicted arabinose efflux permease, MFS family n=1 Tax=Vreelandella arcis TaxID=416873 RepID=A0A1H0HLT5_9GAMM|nr:MFS transporter [Halomonas arcis]SDO20169.1 Predicted arabinose efflux permease, MFS family [Halomonas arcis]